jgi:hypothetical protein
MEKVEAGNSDRAIVFLVPGKNKVNGGVMSIYMIAGETEQLKEIHQADVFICSYPGSPPLLRITKFPNNAIILDFKSLLTRFKKGTEVLVHIPEIFVSEFLVQARQQIASRDFRWHFNIMLQNIDLAPTREDIRTLSEFGSVTVTAAHVAYSGAETERALGCTVHHLSARASPEPYERKSFSERENIFVISPDPHERRKEILSELRRRLPDFRFITVKRMTYSEYRKLIASAKFSLTFGEGMDGYFTEMTFGGGIGCAVYNTRFFTEPFASLPFVYDSWDTLLLNLPDDVRAANTAEQYDRNNMEPCSLLSEIYSPDIFREKVKSYYSIHFRSE